MYAIDIKDQTKVLLKQANEFHLLVCPVCGWKVKVVTSNNIKKFDHSPMREGCCFYDQSVLDLVHYPESKCQNISLISPAYDQTINDVVRPNSANKTHKFSCLSCNKNVRLVSKVDGLRVFEHIGKSPCSYFTQPNNEELLNIAKNNFAFKLSRNCDFYIQCTCLECYERVPWKIHHLPGDVIKIDYIDCPSRDNPDGDIIDVAIVNQDIVRYSFSIGLPKDKIRKSTSWFHLDVREALFDAKVFGFIHSVNKCQSCILKKEPWMILIPTCVKSGPKDNWVQEKICMCCGCQQYEPIFYKGSRIVCRLCLNSKNFETLRLDLQKQFAIQSNFTNKEKMECLLASEITTDEEKTHLRIALEEKAFNDLDDGTIEILLKYDI